MTFEEAKKILLPPIGMFKITRIPKRIPETSDYISWLEQEILGNEISGSDHYRCHLCGKVNHIDDMDEADINWFFCKDCGERKIDKITKVP